MGAQVTSFQNVVIPAKAGIHSRRIGDSHDDLRLWIPACAGMTKVLA